MKKTNTTTAATTTANVWTFAPESVTVNGRTFPASYSIARSGDVYVFAQIKASAADPALPVRMHITASMPMYADAMAAAEAAKAAPAVKAEPAAAPAEPAPVQDAPAAEPAPAKKPARKAKAAKAAKADPAPVAAEPATAPAEPAPVQDAPAAEPAPAAKPARKAAKAAKAEPAAAPAEPAPAAKPARKAAKAAKAEPATAGDFSTPDRLIADVRRALAAANPSGAEYAFITAELAELEGFVAKVKARYAECTAHLNAADAALHGTDCDCETAEAHIAVVKELADPEYIGYIEDEWPNVMERLEEIAKRSANLPAPAAEPAPAKDAAKPVEKPWIGTAITGNGWRIAFDADAQRTRVVFDAEPTAAQRDAVEAAGFYRSAKMGSWNKGLTCKAHRAAQALAATLAALA